MKDTIALIDGDSLIYYEMGKPTLEEALESLDGRLHQMFEVTQATKYAGFLTQGKCFRYGVAKNKPYKGNRKYGDKPIIFPAIKEYLKQHWKFTFIPELEADDLVSVYHGKDTVICSPDKDVLLQNVGSHYNYGKADLVIVNKFEAEYFLWKQVLMGDSTDGIEGLPKVGPKTADTWLELVQPIDMPELVLKKYLEKFGNSNGIDKFAETFKLIYILKSQEDVLRETGIELPELVTYDVKSQNENDLWQ
jgi:hypothetical protein